MELSHYLERWHGDAIGCVEFAAKALAESNHLIHLDSFARKFGLEVFKNLLTCDRIRYLYTQDMPSVTTICKIIQVSVRNKVVCLKNINHDFGHLNIMLLNELQKDKPIFSIRAFVDAGEEPSPFLRCIWHGQDSEPTFEEISGHTDNEEITINGKWHVITTNHSFDKDYLFWNFQELDNKVVDVYPNHDSRSDAFLDMINTRRASQMIEFVSNVLGFQHQNRIKRNCGDKVVNEQKEL